jgi:hypothetical protein
MNLRRLAFHPQKMLPCWKEKHLQRVRNKIPTVPSSMSAFRVHQTKNIWMQPPRDPKDWRVTLTLQPTQQKDQETLVGGFEPWILYVFHILGMSSSQLTNSIIFQRGSTTNQNWWFYRVQAHRIHGHCLRSNPRVTSSYPSRTSFQARLDP